MQRDNSEFLGHPIGLPDGEVGDEHCRAGRLDAEPFPVFAALAMAEGGKEVDLFDHAALRLRHRDVNLLRAGRDLGRAAAAG